MSNEGTPVVAVLKGGRSVQAIRRPDGVIVESVSNAVIPVESIANVLESLVEG